MNTKKRKRKCALTNLKKSSNTNAEKWRKRDMIGKSTKRLKESNEMKQNIDVGLKKKRQSIRKEKNMRDYFTSSPKETTKEKKKPTNTVNKKKRLKERKKRLTNGLTTNVKRDWKRSKESLRSIWSLLSIVSLCMTTQAKLLLMRRKHIDDCPKKHMCKMNAEDVIVEKDNRA